MKSSIVESLGPDDEGTYSDLQVLKSNAGYYIGTIFTSHDGFKEPESRDSGYYRTEAEAQRALDDLSFEQREHP
jgi:hypothetical protein